MLCDRDCDWSYLKLVIVAGGNIGSDAVANSYDQRRGYTLGGGGGSTLGGGTLLCISVSTLGGGSGLWNGGCAGGLGVWYYSCPPVSCISCVITIRDRRGYGLIVGCVGCGGGAVLKKISWRRSNARIDDSWRCGGIFTFRDDARFAAAAMMASSEVDVGLVIYLCLNKTVLDILGVCVSFIHIFQ